MTEPLRILLIEDSETDAKLVINEVRRIRDPLQFERVQDVAALRTALTGRAWDLIICDWSLPALNAPTALNLVREIALDVPFIIVSGTVGEEAAVEAMRKGAHDYVLKDKLARLGPAIERELRDHAERLARRKSDQEVRAAEKAALASTAMLRSILDSVGDGILVARPQRQLHSLEYSGKSADEDGSSDRRNGRSRVAENWPVSRGQDHPHLARGAATYASDAW
ncbi:MAG: response regulator [Deltaproteobacteria bacterium]|nr:response regulator [Deltaproteobacteria bacterium]